MRESSESQPRLSRRPLQQHSTQTSQPRRNLCTTNGAAIATSQSHDTEFGGLISRKTSVKSREIPRSRAGVPPRVSSGPNSTFARNRTPNSETRPRGCFWSLCSEQKEALTCLIGLDPVLKIKVSQRWSVHPITGNYVISIPPAQQYVAQSRRILLS